MKRVNFLGGLMDRCVMERNCRVEYGACVGRSVADVHLAEFPTSANLEFTGDDRSSIGSSPEAVGFYASSRPQGSRKEDREPSHWRRRYP